MEIYKRVLQELAPAFCVSSGLRAGGEMSGCAVAALEERL